MKRKIFLSIFFTAFIGVLLSVLFVSCVFYANYDGDLRKHVRDEAVFVSSALDMAAAEKTGSYLEEVGKESINRVTLISTEGTILYDNYAKADEMENHLSRPEVSEALESGTGEATRLSDTLGQQTYYYAVRLDDGDVLRISFTTKSVFGIMGNVLVWVVFISAFILIITVLIATVLTNKIINPINRLDLNEPLLNDTYDELSPLLGRMEKQNEEISRQMSAMDEQRREFDFVTGNMSEGIVIFGKNGAVLFANESAKRIFGAQEVHSYLQLCRDKAYVEAVESAIKGTSCGAGITVGDRLYSLSLSPVKADIKSYAAVMFIIDVTEKEDSEKMRREFTANVSHELKTPLTSIMGYAEIIGNGIADEKDIPRFTEQIRSEAARLLVLIEDIIKLSRLDEDDLRQQFEPTDLDAICRNVGSDLAAKAKSAGIDFSYDGSPCVITGFPSVLHEMVFNLCDNAIAYNKRGGSVKLTLADNVITVADTGIGIAEDDKERIFERFYRVDKSHSKATGGTGLGLSIVKHGALIHNARIELESELGRGTEIRLVFPL